MAKLLAGDAPGLDLVIYGCVLILVIAFAGRGIAGLLTDLRDMMQRLTGRKAAPPEHAHG